MSNLHKGIRTAAAASLLAFTTASVVRADPDINLSGEYTTIQEFACTSDTTVNLNGVSFANCQLKLTGNVTFTINLVDGTQNRFEMITGNKECIKATKKSNIIFTGTGNLELLSEKRITDGGARSGILVCNDLTVRGGDIKVTFDQNKSDTSCIFLKGNYLQEGGRVKVNLKKKNVTNEFHGVTFDTAGTTFTLEDGEFNAEIAGTKSRAIDLKKSCSAFFRGGKVKAEFEGPGGRFVSGGTRIEFSGGRYEFTTNVTAKMTAEYYPVDIAAVKAQNAIVITAGEFDADLPLEGSEVFTTDSDEGTTIDISGGDFDLVAGNDCIHATQDISVSGGNLRCTSIGDDVIDANGSLTISGGNIRAYATSPDAHAFDVNSGRSGGVKKTLTILGGTVIGTDGIGATPIGSDSPDVGKKDFRQPTYYGVLQTSDYAGKYLSLSGTTNGVTFTVKPRLPDFPGGETFNLLVSIPGRTASKPEPKTAAEAYGDANTRTPLVFERKASISGRTVTTREGEIIVLNDYYDLDPAEGKSKTISLSLNETARPVIGSIAVGESVSIDVVTRTGLWYGIQSASSPNGNWTAIGEDAAGDGTVKRFSADKSEPGRFFRAVATDVP